MNLKEQQQFLSEALDANKVVLFCGRHGYRAGDPLRLPTSGCESCAKAWFIHEFAKMPPHQRAEKLEQLERALHDATRLEDRGKFDFQPYNKPTIEIVKE